MCVIHAFPVVGVQGVVCKRCRSRTQTPRRRESWPKTPGLAMMVFVASEERSEKTKKRERGRKVFEKGLNPSLKRCSIKSASLAAAGLLRHGYVALGCMGQSSSVMLDQNTQTMTTESRVKSVSKRAPSILPLVPLHMYLLMA